MLSDKIIQSYSQVLTPIGYTNDNTVSFEGSQIQQEFFKAWEHITKYYKQNPTKKLTFLEIGAWKGLWGIAFCEFCKLQNIEGNYITLTEINQDPNNQSLYKTLEYINSQDISATLLTLDTEIVTNENTMGIGLIYRKK
jgi:hypothetical protein